MYLLFLYRKRDDPMFHDGDPAPSRPQPRQQLVVATKSTSFFFPLTCWFFLNGSSANGSLPELYKEINELVLLFGFFVTDSAFFSAFQSRV